MIYYKDGVPSCNIEGGTKEVNRMLETMKDSAMAEDATLYYIKAVDLLRLIDRQEEKARLERDVAG